MELISNKMDQDQREMAEIAQETTKTRRQRKRKSFYPQVLKNPPASEVIQRNFKKCKLKNQLKSKKLKKISSPTRDLYTPSIFSENSEDWNELSDLADFIVESTFDLENHILKTMGREVLNSEILRNGYYPIHDAIFERNCFKLQRQIHVCTKLKNMNLNELLTDDGEDCLQLAVQHDASSETIKILLDAGLQTDLLDTKSNTIIHLAIKNELNLAAFELLLPQIDLNSLLLLNDDGYNPLHLAVRNDSFLHAESLLNHIDKFVFKQTTYMRHSDNDNVQCTKEEFLKFYETECDNLNADIIKANKLKQKFIDSPDAKSGSSTLYYAIENNMLHFAYFLLAHLSEPRLTNYSEQSVKSFYNENSKILHLGPKLDRIIDKVTEILDKKY